MAADLPFPPSVPRGVPGWLWPPPGAEVRHVVFEEGLGADGRWVRRLVAGQPLLPLQRGSLTWLLEDLARAPPVPPGRRVTLSVARTALPGGRVGHAYALDGGPLGRPGSDPARGVLWRVLHDPRVWDQPA